KDLKLKYRFDELYNWADKIKSKDKRAFIINKISILKKY
ncbi:unnamed protein product, partial [marine sediment metagenome]